MNEIKDISIRQYLENKGIRPSKNYGYYGMYYSPFRKDRNASMKVDYNQNVWNDFGTNEGGTIIDLVMKMENLSFHEATIKLEDRLLSSQLFQQPYIPMYSQLNVATSQHSDSSPFSFHWDKVIPITHPKLIAWVQERKINLELANKYCREIHYHNQSGNHFSVGFKNDHDGYELSSPPYFKSCISPKDITTIRNNRDTCLVFEGFWDFLSYLMFKKIEKTRYDVAILNSTVNTEKAMIFLKSHREIYTYLDNDDGGRTATELIKSANSTMYNRSSQFTEYKDLNDFLREIPKAKLPVKKKKSGLKL
ncbi:DNA primase [termite gut metagenome]|uniref:DNA primase n=1 Tax=termite gut metagenome TaxID=433724 RepID=A0A5J4RYT9_9ZZZZ